MKMFTVAAVAALLFLPFAVAVAHGVREQGGRIEITATRISYNVIDQGPPGRTANLVTQIWRLNDRIGHPIGRMLVVCRWIRPPWRMCTGEVRLPLGTIVWTGSSQPPLNGQSAVTGGTERYFGTAGKVVFTEISVSKVVLSLTLVE